MKVLKPFLLSVCVLCLLSCGTNDSGEIERTYPEAFNFETVTIPQLLSNDVTPDSVNIKAFVFEIYQCPEGASCFLADRVAVSEKLPPADTLYIVAKEPKQFQEQKQYTISLSVNKRESQEMPHTRLLGYSLVK